MSILKHEIPILEFDTESTAVINPNHEELDLKLPKKCVFAFLGDYIDTYANKTDTRQVSLFISATKHYPIYNNHIQRRGNRSLPGAGGSCSCCTDS